MSRVIVVGAGFAGLAAAWSAQRRGADVTLVSTGPGASEMSSGALDEALWETIRAATLALGEHATCGPLADEVHALCAALAIFRLPAAGEAMPILATTAGVLRLARGHDCALLDVAPLRSGCVYVPRVGRSGWDADAIARALSDSPLARERDLVFRALDAQILRHSAEWRIGDTDLAMLHDGDARLEWLGARLGDALGPHAERARGLLLGPWLGAAQPRAAALTARLGIPVGEALIGAGSPAGFRFAAARARLIADLGIVLVDARVDKIARSDGSLHVELEGDNPTLVADAIVLACGGMIGGGIVYRPAESTALRDLPPRAIPPFQLTIAADVVIGIADKRLGETSSLHGPNLDESAWPVGHQAGALEAIGVLCDGVVVRSGGDSSRPWPLRAAGDVMADRPRTVLEAMASGVLAGAHAGDG
jgi:glycerol-3-phosphate dehydrogenase subunit B